MKSKMLATIMMTPAGDELGRAPSAHGRHDVDEHADEREDVGVDPKRHARAR